MEEEKIQDSKVESEEVAQTQQGLNVASDLKNKRLMKKGMFITGLVFFALVVVMFVVTCCLKGYIANVAHSGDSAEDSIAFVTLLIVMIPVFFILLIPMLAFFITSLVLFIKTRNSTNQKIRLTSNICMWIDVAIFVTMIILLLVWIFAR